MSLAYPSSIKVQFLERVGRGETVRAVCAEPGMPCEGSIQVWRRAAPGFAGELAAARARGDWRRRLAPSTGEGLLSRSAQG